MAVVHAELAVFDDWATNNTGEGLYGAPLNTGSQNFEIRLIPPINRTPPMIRPEFSG